ncbi:hypothetical protein IQ260_14810 [Leptolyngbya cf. ectocarpi LEGE 11479]|uniref:Uncharacterized protein n=1 Tax=Leptolyngbya cf. ectocarpi LEGE 11479 TaxID=1828722 RepID=A0A928ZUW7_LEPEC|nr:hypothetical protein [Leptolyngbya ectocarpi]MBE9067922.1 hypothetical protein [Leptolyngbya cf. ectocarpi LEGE 11479]
MDSLKSLILPAFLGLTAGVAHGVISHQAGLPMSLTDQLVQPWVANNTVSYSFKD